MKQLTRSQFAKLRYLTRVDNFLWGVNRTMNNERVVCINRITQEKAKARKTCLYLGGDSNVNRLRSDYEGDLQNHDRDSSPQKTPMTMAERSRETARMLREIDDTESAIAELQKEVAISDQRLESFQPFLRASRAVLDRLCAECGIPRDDIDTLVGGLTSPSVVMGLGRR